MGAFGMFIYQGVGLLKQFFSKPVSTSVSVTFEKVRCPLFTLLIMSIVSAHLIKVELCVIVDFFVHDCSHFN